MIFLTSFKNFEKLSLDYFSKIIANNKNICNTNIDKDISNICNELYPKEKGNIITNLFNFNNEPIVVIGVMNGAFTFVADLVRKLKSDLHIDFISVSSYEGTESTGELKMLKDIKVDIKDKNVLLIEDIVDTGTTLQYFINKIETESPASVHIASLLVKPAAMKFDLYIKFSGFDIENNFVVGYGLDYNDHGRNLKHIYQLND